MSEDDRRSGRKIPDFVLKRDLNMDQIDTLRSLEQVGWELKFIRRANGKALPIVFDGDRKKFAVLELDGRLNEHPGFDIRG